MGTDKLCITIANACCKSAREDERNSPCEMWRGRGIVFFNAIIEMCHHSNIGDDASVLWDLNRLASACEGHRELKLWMYLMDLPGFTFDKPAPDVSFNQHLSLMNAFSSVILDAHSQAIEHINRERPILNGT